MMNLIISYLIFFISDVEPPGTIKVNNIYFDKTETQNIHWLEFLYYKKQELDSVNYLKLLPESANNWYDIPDRRFEPIVFITYNQAIEYCKWRSLVVSNKLGREVVYRLPTKEEWRLVAENVIKSNHKSISEDLQKTKAKIKKSPNHYVIQSIEKPKNRVYYLFDNVSEMTIEKGIGIGSNNYQLTDLESNLTTLINYDSPNLYLGFRCVAEFKN